MSAFARWKREQGFGHSFRIPVVEDVRFAATIEKVKAEVIRVNTAPSAPTPPVLASNASSANTD